MTPNDVDQRTLSVGRSLVRAAAIRRCVKFLVWVPAECPRPGDRVAGMGGLNSGE